MEKGYPFSLEPSAFPVHACSILMSLEFFATLPTYLGEQYRRLARRIGKKKALVAVAHSILVIIYHILKEEKTYHELGSTYFEERERDAVKRRALRSLEQLGYEVSLQEKEDVA